MVVVRLGRGQGQGQEEGMQSDEQTSMQKMDEL